MKTGTVILHGLWAALAVGAFLAGRAPDGDAAAVSATGGGEANRGSGANGALSAPASWTFGPGDSPAGFSAEMTEVLAVTDEEDGKSRVVALLSELTPQVLDGLTEEMVPGLLQMFQAADFSATWHKQEGFCRAWARLNPEAAFAYVTDPTEKFGTNSYGRTAVITEWAKMDMAAAQKAIAGLENSNDRHNLGNRLMTVLADTDLDAALTYSAKLWREEKSTSGIYRLVKKLRNERGIEGVQEWLDTTGPSELGEGVVEYKKEAIEWLANRGNAAEIGDFLVANANEPYVDSTLLLEVAEELSRKAEDRARADLDWIAGLSGEIEEQGQAIATRFEKYMKDDFEGAAAWLVGQELGPAHDDAIEIFVRNATMDDVPAARRWAEQISDAELRAAAVQFVQERGG